MGSRLWVARNTYKPQTTALSNKGHLTLSLRRILLTVETYYQKETFINQDKWGLAFKRAFSSTFLLKCPVCAQDNVFKNPLELKDTCSICYARLERDKGSAIISGVLSYFLAIVLTLLIMWPLIARFGLFDGITFACVGIVTVLIFALHRPTKGMYLWMLWCFGFVYPDSKPVGE